MSGLLTVDSVLMCPHGGSVQAIPSSADAQTSGSPLVTASDTFLIAGCTFVIGVVPSPCLSVQWVQPAMNSSVDGNPTLTMASVGLCLAATQAVQGTVIVAQTQPNVSGQ